jgi:asparaginyl-tRNA synthetase
MPSSQEQVRPRALWRDPGSHFIRALEDPWFRALVTLQDAISTATAQFWSARGAKTLHLPLTTGSISSPMGLGSDSTPVRIDLHGVPTYLADSMQFLLEWGCRLNPAGAYYVMPSFRGDANDATHLSQFYHSEVEIPGGLDELIPTAEAYLVFLVEMLLAEHGDLIASIAGTTHHLESVVAQRDGFPRLTFDDAVDTLGGDEEFIEYNGSWRNIRRAGELRLLEEYGGPVWVTHWDHLAVPFYQAFADGERTTRNADLLLGTCELIGAGERHENGDQIRRALELHRVPAAEYGWYMRMKDEYPMHTSGFGMGVERFLLWVLSHDDIRDMQLLPREKGVDIAP